jgi:FkbM family methyltransferase
MAPATSRLRELARPVLGHPRVLPAAALALRAATTRDPVRFAGRELAGREALVLYGLRSGPLRVGVRHGTGDVVTLGEVFHERDYAPPAEVLAALPDAPRILDLGANVGMFGVDALQRWPKASVIAYEPDPDNAAVHSRVIGANGLGDRWTLVEAAAGAAGGVASFLTGQVALSRVVDGPLGGEVVQVEVVDVLDEVGRSDLVKIDVEGGEWPILADPRFAANPPRALAAEVHPEGCPAEDPLAEARRLLDAAGMAVHVVWQRGPYAMLWAWRT